MIFGNGEILKEQINTIKPFYIFDIKDRKDEKEREKSTYSHLNENKHHYYVEGNKYSTYIEPATKFWNLDELYNCIKELFKIDSTGIKWYNEDKNNYEEYSLDHTFDSEYDLGVYCVIRTSETDYQLILIDKFIINRYGYNADVLNNVLDFYNWTEYFGKEWEEMKKKRRQ